jgi:GPH family glycoside/pentoside/hexuronide:cation symporter
VTDSVREAIRWSYYGWPIVLLAVQAGVILSWPMSSRRANLDQAEPQPAS